MMTGIIFSTLFAATAPDTFVFNNGAEVETLDPHRMSGTTDTIIALQTFEGLVRRGKDFNSIVPAVASQWTVSKDKTVYTFTIRPNNYWSNGDLLTPEHVRASLIRAMMPEVNSQYIKNYTDNIEGAAEYVAAYSTPNRQAMEDKIGIRIVGNDKIEIKLKRPYAFLLEQLAHPSFAIIHPSMADPSSPAWRTPKSYIVNGPYFLKDWVINKHIVLEKNPKYYEKDQVQIEKVVAIPLNEESTTLNMFLKGDLDWTGYNTISSVQVPVLRSKKEFRMIPGYGTYTYIFNLKKKPLDDARVRKAMSLAIQRGEITDKVLRGGQVPTRYIVAPGVEGYPYNVSPPPPFEEQIKEAQRLLAEAGFPGGKGFPRLTILYNTTEGHHKIAQAVQQMWKKYLGIDVAIQNMEWKVFLKEQQDKRFDISRQSWIGGFPEPIELLEPYVTGNENNHSSYTNAEFDRLMMAQSTTPDRKKRMEDAAKGERILLDELPAIPIYHYTFYGLVQKNVEGLDMNGFHWTQFRYISKKPKA